jgi:hypothetical protein
MFAERAIGPALVDQADVLSAKGFVDAHLAAARQLHASQATKQLERAKHVPHYPDDSSAASLGRLPRMQKPTPPLVGF